MTVFRGAMLLCGLALMTAIAAPARSAPLTTDTLTEEITFSPGLICDTKDQAER